MKMIQNDFTNMRKIQKGARIQKKINAMKAWTIKDMDEIVQYYILEMESIVDHHDDIGALDEILYETEQPQNTLIQTFFDDLYKVSGR